MIQNHEKRPDVPPPVQFEWDGEVMRPTQRFRRLAQRSYMLGGVYMLTEREEISTRSRGHYFAALRDAHDSLPEDKLEDYPTVEHLRKRLLIKAGYFHMTAKVFKDTETADMVAAFLRPKDPFAVVIVSGNIVKEYVAMSQSSRAMTDEVFQQSKMKVLHLVDELIGVQSGTTNRQGRTAR